MLRSCSRAMSMQTIPLRTRLSKVQHHLRRLEMVLRRRDP
jgi:hypothetical protein